MNTNKRKRIPQVALLLDSCHETSRGMMRGIFEYVRLYGPWQLNILTGGALEQKLPSCRFWKGSGVIAHVYNPEMAEAINASRLPAVIFDANNDWQEAWSARSQISQVQCDSVATGQMAAKHFIQKGFINFAFVSDVRGLHWSRWRRTAFSERLGLDGLTCSVYPEPDSKDWEMERKQMIQWLKMLPKPVAIFVAHDARARQVLDACMAAGIHVPYEAAVLGVDNDPLICETCIPSLSSIRLDVEAAGFAAAELLDKRMFGRRKWPKETVTYQPVEIVSRLSTQATHVNDKLVIAALEYIRINAGLNIRVSDVADHTKVTPRWLEKRFERSLEYSVFDEIKRVRMQTIKKLVVSTNQPFDQIARKCGFSSVNHLRKLFRDETDLTMSAYRTKHGKCDVHGHPV